MFYNSRLWPFTLGVRGRLAGTVAVGVLAAGVGIARLALLGWLLAKVYAGEGLAAIALPAALVGGLMLARGVLEYARAMLAHGTAARVQLNVRRTLYDHLLELGPAYLTRERSGGVTLTMAEGVEQLETYFGQYLPQLAVAAITPIAVFAAIAFIDLPVALTLFVFALATLLAPTLFHRWDERNSRRRRHAYHDYGAEFMDAMQGLATLKAFGRSEARGKLLADKAREVTRSTMWVLATNLLTRGITDTGIAVGAAAALALGAHRVTNGLMSLEALLVILMMGIEVFRPQRDLRSLLHQGMVGRAAADGIFALLDAKPLVPSVNPDNAAAIQLAPTVRFDEVCFSYPPGDERSSPEVPAQARSETPRAHEHLSFEVRAGERVGFVGQSGCGKSTIVRLLLRQFDPDSGTVSIGGRDLRDLPAEAIYSQLAVVGQDAFLFHGTVEENLRVGRKNASLQDIETAARNANAFEFVTELPQGFATVIGERGIRLSGGQRQRLAIARALLSDAPILVLDEALSAVDAENEAVIAQALERLMAGRTTLIFAHRLSSVIRADRLLVMEAGTIVESGDHKALMARRGVYHHLMAAQAEDGARHAIDDELAPTPERADGGESSGALAAVRAEEAPLPDEILRAEGVGWVEAARALLRHAGPWRGKLSLTFMLGVVRVAALIGVGVVSALAVAAVKQGADYGHWLAALAVLAPAAGVLHWLEPWLAHDLAFEMLAELRIELFQKLEQLAPAFLVRRRSGDLVAMATHDVELVEYFYAHTVTPALVAVLVPGIVIAVLLDAAWPLALALAPFLVLVGASPFALRKRVDRLGSRDREALGELNAHIADTVQGLGEILAFRNGEQRRSSLVKRVQA
ncbi:MAG: ABC transporter transmembrane domain-containing protein, partial [Gammaproteobacteria bacterium]